MEEVDQWGKKSSHHWISSRDSLFRVLWWCNSFTVVLRSINRRENILPGLTILLMNPSFPMRDFSCLFVQVRLFLQLINRSMLSWYLSSVTSMIIRNELMPMPRKIMYMDGPSILSMANGISKSLKARMIVWSCWRATDSIFPKTAKKSSE